MRQQSLPSKKRVLTGDRPTGRLHLGHYVGSLKNRVRLQEEYDCFFIIADYHMLTTHFARVPDIVKAVDGLVLDYLSVGIDPAKSTIYLQSLVPEVAELALLLSMLVPVTRLQRVPTLKDKTKEAHLETASLGLLAYPVTQAADILMVRAHVVPVGRDQASHIEVTRELARRFNATYGEVFPIPDPLLGEVPTLVGIDGKAKMSKSLENAIFLNDDPEAVRAKVQRMYTDPGRVHASDPGRVQGNPLFIYFDAFAPRKEEIVEYKVAYRKGKIGDVALKKRLAEILNDFLEPVRQRRAACEKDLSRVRDIVIEGSKRARHECVATLEIVKSAMGLRYTR